ncbi:MAG TPA: 4,5-DOPA dioxygenase extradiol [Candidatus Eremiobacteraceae bacterium]|jgi:4,5-DOPA dioxygenase extradiol
MNGQTRMPAVFIGHGSPMNAIEDTPYSRAWRELGASLPRPRAILCVSAHYYRRGTAATANERPPTIHDFGNFPRELHEMRYPAPGDPELAAEAARLLAPTAVELDERWGLDHGSWSILVHMYPNADIPVVELSVDEDKSPDEHYDLGGKLAPLRERGVLVMATGNVVHNLERFNPSMSGAYDWGERFDGYIRGALEANDRAALVGYEGHPDAALAAPDRDHFLPILYIAGIRSSDEPISWVVDGGLGLGAVSMRAFRVG